MSGNIFEQWVGGTYVNNRKAGTDAIVLRTIYEDPKTGEIVPKLKIVKNPRRRFWLTKKEHRTHAFKKEYTSLTKLDEFTCYNKDIAHRVAKELNGYAPSGYIDSRELYNSPYVYGADISMNTLIRRQYVKKYGDRDVLPISVGFLDIETSMLHGSYGEINLITVTHNNRVYTALHDSYLYKVHDSVEGPIKVKATVEEVMESANSTLAEYIKEHDLKIECFVADHEMKLLKWIIDVIHKNKTDYIGIWNMDYDIPHILGRCEKYNLDPKVFCNSEVPDVYKKAFYKKDKRNTPHLVEKWHWFYVTGYTQFVDSMALYARLRKHKGYLPSYKLNAVLKKELGLAKLSLGEEDSHPIMQSTRFVDYCVYNMFDSIALYLLELKNGDISTMLMLSGITPPEDYAKQTVLVKNDLYDYALANNKMIAATGAEMKDRYTALIKNFGGTVLEPEKSKGAGINAITEQPHMDTLLFIFVADVDFSAYYPNTQCACNISKETKLSTAIEIEGKTRVETQSYFAEVVAPKENAVHIGHTYYGLPNYSEMDEIYLNLMSDSQFK